MLTWFAAPMIAVVGGTYAGLLLRWFGYHAVPSPEGMVARVEVPVSHYIFGRVTLRAVVGDPCVIEARFRMPEEVVRFEYGALTEEGLERAFDFDGDGVVDRVREWVEGREAIVEVLGGGRGDVLFRDRDPVHSSEFRRATELPDLDGDGRSELGLHHPRDDRSVDDLGYVDSVMEVRSWVTVVSYLGE